MIILSQILKSNALFKVFCEQTVLNFIFDKVEIKHYRPGQLICRMSKRSPVNYEFKGLYRSTYNKFKEAIDKDIAENMVIDAT